MPNGKSLAFGIRHSAFVPMPRVSVIIPTYNRAALLCETLDSVYAQTCRDYEIIVVDDGSTDDTFDRLADGKRGSLGSVIYQRLDHAGQGAARNAGLVMAQGQYIAFLDSDDLWEPQFLDRMLEALEGQPGAGFAYCDYATFDRQGPVQAVCLTAREKICGDLFPALLASDFLCTGALLFRRECFERVGGFDPRLPLVEDWDMWLRVAHEHAAVYVDAPLLRVRQNPRSASRNPELVYSLNLHVFARLQRDLNARRFRPVIARQISNFHRALASYYASQRRPRPAFKHATLAVVRRFL